jgi:hypothetical protein
MFISNLNEQDVILVGRYENPYDPADYAAYLKAFARVVAAARTHGRPVVLIIDIQDGYPSPNALQRKSIGEAWANAIGVGGVIAIITGSALIRGIITAIEWFLKNSPTHRETRAYARASDAVLWLADQSGVATSELTAAIDAVRLRPRSERVAS